jgi:hypothetical protein
MRKNLSPEEGKVLSALADAFPRKLQLDALAKRTATDHAALLNVIDRLLVRKLIECKCLRGSEGLVAAANILISELGNRALDESQPQERAPQPIRATVLNVLIASPCDVSTEREMVVGAIQDWNASHVAQTGIMLQPVRWETHSYPAVGDRPQGILNRQIVDSGHVLIAIFGSRLGTPTGEAMSGTIEEIERFRRTSRYVALYFSDAPVPGNTDLDQFEALKRYRQERQGDSLYFTYSSAEDLRRLVSQHLPKIVAEVQKQFQPDSALSRTDSVDHSDGARVLVVHEQPVVRSASDDLNPKEIELLWNAAKDPDGQLVHSATFDGEEISVNDRDFLEGADVRSVVEWRGALGTLEARGLIEPLGNDGMFFRLTADGYKVADQLEEFARWSAQSVVLRANYFGAPCEERRITCKAVIAIPTVYFADQVGADGAVMRSVKERRALLVEGISSRPTDHWTPNEVEFVDIGTQRTERFQVDGMEFLAPGHLKLPIVR